MVLCSGYNGERLTDETAPADWIKHFDLSDYCGLANALADAWNMSGLLASELDEEECPEETKSQYDAWKDETLRLIQLAARQCGDDTHLDKLKPFCRTITVFMEQNGFYYGSGWWIRLNPFRESVSN